ncbi:hypothetical protein [Streptomyces sp. NBC_00199]|uniref:hypothetical protein n=1 Tax=Streptomyces sp. NBC_00199 TaxID=2975678 RepID=UPI0022579324|nr:hypothetical protein [Streptomyces sp. NBC_00199]MCX5269370.1 hypothetical protein [Streptomyces sp. NBC_00199]
MSDPTGLRPLSGCEQGCSDGKGGTTRDWMTPSANGWVYHSTDTYTQNVQFQTPGGGTGSGTMTITVRTDGGHKSAKITFQKGPDPKPERKDGAQCKSCYAMGTNPYCDPNAHDLPDTPKLKTWQKVVLGVVTAVTAVVVGAPVIVAGWQEISAACLFNPAGCGEVISEIGTAGAAGGSMASGAAGAYAYGARGARNAANGVRLAEQLKYEADAAAAAAMFTADGNLTAQTIARSTKIIDGSKIGNKHLEAYFKAHGGVDQWGKYGTPRLSTPGSEGTFAVHFYMNEVTGEVYYYDYKIKLGGG